MINTVKKIVVDECKHIVKPSSKSILRRKALSNFHHSQVVTEMEEMCPVSLSLLSAMANYKNEIQKKIKLGNCFSVLMNTRNKNCNISQKVNSILMYKGKIRVKVCILHFEKKKHSSPMTTFNCIALPPSNTIHNTIPHLTIQKDLPQNVKCYRLAP